ncbi:MAG: ATP-binding protein, partial [Actinomycetota bacterium]
GITFSALSEIVKAHCGILESDDPQDAFAKLGVAVEAIEESPSERDWLMRRVAPLVGADPHTGAPAERGESFAAWRTFFEGIASFRPLVLVFEDLHWADAAMLDLIEHLVEWTTGVPLLVICTARAELFGRHPRWGGGTANSTTVSLAPLANEEITQLIGALLRDAALPGELQAALLQRCGGNPLYAEEFVRVAGERGLLDGGSEQTAGYLPESHIPGTIHALISARLDGLPPEQKAIVHEGSVIGKSFWMGALVSMTGVDRSRAEDALHQLARKEIVRVSRRSSVEGDREFSFWHLLIRDIAYGQIPRPVRARKHRAVAEWMESIAGRRIVDRAEVIAHHYGEALTLGRASRVDAGELRELEARARRFLDIAGDRIMQLDPARAESYYRQALKLYSAQTPEVATVLVKATEAGWLAGRLNASDAERQLREVIEVLLGYDNVPCAGETMVKLSRVVWERGDPVESHALLSEATRLLEGRPPSRELAFASAQMTGYQWAVGEAGRCLEWADKTLTVADELGLPEQVVGARGFRGAARGELGDAGGLEDLQEAVRAGSELGLGRATAVQFNNLGWLTWLIEGPRRALDVFESGLHFSDRRGLVPDGMWMSLSRQEALFDLGEWDELLLSAQKVLHWDAREGATQAGLLAMLNQSQVLLWRGELDEVSALQDGFLTRARAIGEAPVLV